MAQHDDAVAKSVFLWRYATHPSNGYCHQIFNILNELDFPHPVELLEVLPSQLTWKAHIKSLLHIRVYEELISSSNTMSNIAINASPNIKGSPFHLFLLFKDDISMARLIQFRVRLLLHCSELNDDTGNRANIIRNRICPPCSSEVESAYHFLVSCIALDSTRCRWVREYDPNYLFNIIIGVVRILDRTSSVSQQEYLTRFVAALREARRSLLPA